MIISDYFKEVEQKIVETKIIAEKKIDYKEFSSDEGMIRGKLLFINGYVLEFMEYVCIGKERPKYRFNLMDKNGRIIFRYDNAPHHNHPNISTFPHHKHLPGEIEESKEKEFIEVLKEIETLALKI
ncbi:MAG: DUF6516 family protein [Methanobacterium sp.]